MTDYHIPPNSTPAQAYGYEAARNVGNVTLRLRALADRLDERAKGLIRNDGDAAGQAADILGEYFNGLANVQIYLYPVTSSAAKADVHHERAKHKED